MMFLVMFFCVVLDVCAAVESFAWPIEEAVEEMCIEENTFAFPQNAETFVFPQAGYDSLCVYNNVLNKAPEDTVTISVHYGFSAQGSEACCGGQWNISGLRTEDGWPLKDELFSAARTLYSNPGTSKVLDSLMESIRACGGDGPRFNQRHFSNPLSRGIDSLERGLLWRVERFAEMLPAKPCRFYEEDEAGEGSPTFFEVLRVSNMACHGLMLRGFIMTSGTKRRAYGAF